MEQQQEQSNALAAADLEAKQLDLKIKGEMLGILNRQEDRADGRALADIKQMAVDNKSMMLKQVVDLEKDRAEIEKIKAQTALAGEQAESESMNNQISIYTSTIGVLRDSLTALEGIENAQHQREKESTDNIRAIA